MFVLESPTKVRVLDVRVLSQKDRKPDEQPGAQLLLKATLGAGVLAMFDGFLPGMLYRKSQGKKQTEIDGLETAELTSVGEHVKRLPWVYEQTGCNVTIDLGIGGKSNINLSDCKVHRVSLLPEQKGVVIQWTIDAPGLTDTTRGKLTGLKSTDVQMLLSGPELGDEGQTDIEGANAPAPAKKTASAAVASGAGQASKDALDATGKSPFPAGGAATDDETREAALRDAHAAEPPKGRRLRSVGSAVE